MEKLILLMVIFGTCCAAPQDLSGKVFVFPKETNTDRVVLMTPKTRFNSVTTCVRYQSDLSRTYGIFSLATTTFNNDFVIYKSNAESDIELCSGWESRLHLWVDGKATTKKFVQTGAITGAPIAILGQEQDTYGGGFVAKQSFIGMITDFHMWDTVIPTCEIRSYMEDKHFSPGNVFSWKALDFQVKGQVLMELASEVM
ncbi:Serum amyloid P-component [Dissostichus eleginoides]|uniref:Serum amyloid P-component n=1 Tax=Dissostichus eleginoides TaxID=100907 RepID=A0AAD9C9T4_DISEL|nr:Serum amyloid P-component [Dissostichus eleginoides]